ncbi:hypothetical protein ACVBEH_08175 [Roseateles sp. GG27B]
MDLPKAQWPAFVARIDELLHRQSSLLDGYLPETGQAMAQRFTAQLIALRSKPSSVVPAASGRAKSSETAAAPTAQAIVQGDLADQAAQSARTDQAASPSAATDPAVLAAAERFQEVGLDSIELCRPRSLIIMNIDIASEANLDWLHEQGLHYMVKGRLSACQFDP